MKQLSKLESAIFLLGGVLMVCRCGLLRIWFFTSAAGAGNELGVPAGHHTLQCNAGDAVL